MKTEQELDKLIAQLAPSVEPERDLWPQLQPKLQRQPRRSGLWSGLAVAATVAVIGLVSWNVIMPQGKLPEQKLADASARDTAIATSAEITLLQTYQQLKARQLSQMNVPAPGFDNWQHQSGVWDQAIAQVRYALTFNPDEPQLLAQLQTLYQQQLAYLQQATLPDPLINS